MSCWSQKLTPLSGVPHTYLVQSHQTAETLITRPLVDGHTSAAEDIVFVRLIYICHREIFSNLTQQQFSFQRRLLRERLLLLMEQSSFLQGPSPNIRGVTAVTKGLEEHCLNSPLCTLAGERQNSIINCGCSNQLRSSTDRAMNR